MSRRHSLWTVAIAGWAWACVAPLAAQVVRLPAVEPSADEYPAGLRPPVDSPLPSTPEAGYPQRIPAYADPALGELREDAYPGELLSYPDSTGDLPQRPLELPLLDPERDPNIPPDARPGVFQKLIFDGGWLGRRGRSGLGLYEMEGQVVTAFPFPLPKSHLVVTPGFGVHYLDGPQGVDLPPQLFESYTQFRVMWPATERLGLDVAVTPGVFSDFRQGSDEAVRIAGHGAVMWKWSPTVKIVAGAAQTAREDSGVLPIGGIVWTPNDDWSLEVVAPRPKIARQLTWGGRLPSGVQQWIYVAGEWGGGSWAFRRADESSDVVTLSDLRVILGWERKAIKGVDGRFEVGYVFDREIDFARGTPGVDPPDTVMLRGGLVY